MELLLKGLACALASVVLLRLLDKQGSAVGIPLALVVCLLILGVAIRYLEPVVQLLQTIAQLANVDNQLISIVLKAVGIGLVCQTAALICSDSGSAALGRAIEMTAAAALLWLAVPMINALLELVQTILGEL